MDTETCFILVNGIPIPAWISAKLLEICIGTNSTNWSVLTIVRLPFRAYTLLLTRTFRYALNYNDMDLTKYNNVIIATMLLYKLCFCAHLSLMVYRLHVVKDSNLWNKRKLRYYIYLVHVYGFVQFRYGYVQQLQKVSAHHRIYRNIYILIT